jgi:hypothetical protein
MRALAVLVAGGLSAVLVAPAVGAQQADPPDAGEQLVLEMGGQPAPKAGSVNWAPKGANPYVALVPDPAAVDYSGWKRYAARLGRERANRLGVAAAPILVEEDEPVGQRGANDSRGTAELVPGFGTRSNQNNRARIVGRLSPERVFAEARAPKAEDDGSIPLAARTGIGRVRDGITTSSVIGNGPHGRAGSGSGDFDFFAVRARRGEVIFVDTDTPTGPLDTMAIVYDSEGNVVAFNDDLDGLDSRVDYLVSRAGQYFVAITGFSAVPEDPFDSGSGTGAASEGPYRVTITAAQADHDYYAVRLRKGDVLGASVSGGASRIVLYNPSGVEVMGSSQDATFIYPAETPLPGGGRAVADHVADVDGLHFVAVTSGRGPYAITVEAYRPRLDTDRPVQTLFLDFNGERLNTGIFGGPGVRRLTQLRAFLGRWGLRNADLEPLIDQIVATARENLRRDMIANGRNPDFELVIRNSSDHRDNFGSDNVSRIIVGGTINESGIPTIGIAQSIDPGNVSTEETALVLLDVLSDRAGPFGDPSLNSYIRPGTSRSRKVAFIGRAVGNIVSHEAGHFFGDWHVAQFNRRANLMDQGGNFPLLYGVGADRVGGTRDDVDVDFGRDTFNQNEGFSGKENTMTRLLFALTS